MEVHRDARHAPALCRASTSWLHASKKDENGRDELGHDENANHFQLLEKPECISGQARQTRPAFADKLRV
jgi:hypothetical protein